MCGAFDDVDFTARESAVDVVVVIHYSAATTRPRRCSKQHLLLLSLPDDCDGQLTMNFTAQELCCGCGGGFQWFTNRSRIVLQHLMFDLPSNNANVSSCSQYDQDSSTCGMYVLCSKVFLTHFSYQLTLEIAISTPNYKHKGTIL